MRMRVVMPLRMLACLAVCLASAGAAAVGIAGASAADGLALRQADDAVRACAGSMLSHGLVVPGPGLMPGPAGPGACGVELVSAGGRVLVPVVPAAGAPAVPTGASWLAAHLAGPVTVPGGRWRAVITAVHYRARRIMFVYGANDLRYVISGPAGHGPSGMLIVMAGLAGTGRLAADYAVVAGTVLALLAAAAFALTRAALRPLRTAAGHAASAGQGAAGRVEEALARAPDGLPGWYGMMLAGIRERLRASRAAEAAARGSAADMSGHLADTCLRLRRPASIVQGLTVYLRQQGRPPPADAVRMLHRVTGEITQMETLAQGLRVPPAGEPAGPGHQPASPAADPATGDRPQDDRRPPDSPSHAK